MTGEGGQNLVVNGKAALGDGAVPGFVIHDPPNSECKRGRNPGTPQSGRGSNRGIQR